MIDIAYIRNLYDSLFVRSDEDLEENFDLDNVSDRINFFEDAKKEFLRGGPKTRQGTLDALQFVYPRANLEEYWRYIVPPDLPLFYSGDRREYVRSIFKTLTGQEPSENTTDDATNVLTILDKNWTHFE